MPAERHLRASRHARRCPIVYSKRHQQRLPEMRRQVPQHIAEQTDARWLAGFAQEDLKVAGGRLRRGGESRTLSGQEERVAALVAAGVTNAGIARQLSLSVSTIETHLERIYAKLGIHSRYQLIAMRAAEAQPRS